MFINIFCYFSIYWNISFMEKGNYNTEGMNKRNICSLYTSKQLSSATEALALTILFSSVMPCRSFPFFFFFLTELITRANEEPLRLCREPLPGRGWLRSSLGLPWRPTTCCMSTLPGLGGAALVWTGSNVHERQLPEAHSSLWLIWWLCYMFFKTFGPAGLVEAEGKSGVRGENVFIW